MKTQSFLRAMGFLMGCVLAVAAPVGRAETYSFDWFKVSGGGGVSSNGQYTLSGTMGQHDANPAPMTGGGNYSVTGGFWAIYAVQTAGAPSLTVTATTTNTVLISWPYLSPGFTLQGNSSLGNNNWMNVTNIPTVVSGQKWVIISSAGWEPILPAH